MTTLLLLPIKVTHADVAPQFNQLEVITPENVRFIQDLWTLPLDTGVHDAVWSPDDTLFAITADNNILLYDSQDWGKSPRILKGHRYSIWDLAFSPDGKSLVSGSGDNTARIWDIEKGYARVIITHLPSEVTVFNVSFFDQGKKIITVTDGYDKLRYWDSRTGKYLYSFAIEPPDSWVRMASHKFSEDGTLFGLGTIHNRFRLWKLTPQPEPIRLPLAFDYGVALAFSNDNRYMAVANRYGSEGVIFDFDNDGSNRIPTRFDIVYAQVFDPASKLLVQSTRADAQPVPVIRIWDTARNEQIVFIDPPGKADIRQLTFSHNGKLLITFMSAWNADKQKVESELHFWGVPIR
jgi:WD40 repeat protein